MSGQVAPSTSRRTLKLGVFMCGDSNYHGSGWRHPDAVVDGGWNIKRWVEFARTLEAAKFDMMFLADGPGVLGFDNKSKLRTSTKSERLEPFTLLSALAMVTDHLGLAATGTTTYAEPFNLARTISSLDLLSGGRAAWNVVTGGNPDDALNFNLDKHVPSTERYALAEEFVDVCLALWDSVEPDAFPRDKASGTYADVARLHAINHVGKYYRVKGPMSLLPSPQGRPVIIQAGQSEEGRQLAARISDVTFGGAHSLESAQAFYSDIKRRTSEMGRHPDAVQVLPGVSILVGRDEAEVAAKERILHELTDIEAALNALSGFLGGADLSVYDLDAPAPDFALNDIRVGTVTSYNAIAKEGKLTLRQLAQASATSRFHAPMHGTPTQIADILETWFNSGAADGFNLLPYIVPGSIDDFVELVIPELQRRGLFRTEYGSATLRGNLGLEAPQVGWSRE